MVRHGFVLAMRLCVAFAFDYLRAAAAMTEDQVR